MVIMLAGMDRISDYKILVNTTMSLRTAVGESHLLT